MVGFHVSRTPSALLFRSLVQAAGEPNARAILGHNPLVENMVKKNWGRLSIAFLFTTLICSH
jgi:hypothetical protein